jgi:hypothetical protein
MSKRVSIDLLCGKPRLAYLCSKRTPLGTGWLSKTPFTYHLIAQPLKANIGFEAAPE